VLDAEMERIAPLIDAVLSAHPDKAAAYRDGKTGLLGFFVGQVVKAAAGQASPQAISALVQQRLTGR